MTLTVIILAAGQGKRMNSALPKVLQPLAGQPMLGHVITAARALNPKSIRVVYGHGGEQVRAAFPDTDLQWVLQAQQLGTGHAVKQAMPGVPDEHRVLVLCGDVPLVRPATLTMLLEAAGNGAALLTVDLKDPTGYGRVLRDGAGRVKRIVEQKDATEAERHVTEINTGIMVLPAERLRIWLDDLRDDNAQGEFYLTDVIGMAAEDGTGVAAVKAASDAEVSGINDKRQLAVMERLLQRAQADALLEGGVTLLDPARFDLRGRLTCGKDVSLDVNVVIEGEVNLGDGVVVGPNCFIRNADIGAGTHIAANTVIEGARIGRACRIGPFARIRPESIIGDQAHVGNFVELKKAELHEGAKVNHLSYVGDAIVGARANVGAGTITCNYDGANKHLTTIGSDAFIGSNSSLVAPVVIGDGATIGAGSVVTKDAPAGELTLTRAKQATITGWKRPQKRD